MERLKAEYPKAWMIVTDTHGNISEKALGSFLRLKNVPTATADPLKNVGLLLDSLDADPTVSTSRRRWKLLKGAILGQERKRSAPLAVLPRVKGHLKATLPVKRRNVAESLARHFEFGYPSVVLEASGDRIVDAATVATECGKRLARIRTGYKGGRATLEIELCAESPQPGLVERWMVGETPVVVRVAGKAVKLQDLVSHRQDTGVDNTGNVCMWPCEEILAAWLVQNSHRFDGDRVLELGAGMCGAAGLCLAACSPKQVFITDGNSASVESLKVAVLQNSIAGGFGATFVEASLLKWDRRMDPGLSVDVVVCADCLFFEEFHLDLLHVMRSVGARLAVMVAPSRGGSLERFVGLCGAEWEVKVERKWSDGVEAMLEVECCGVGSADAAWQRQRAQEGYSEDKNEPILLELVRVGGFL